MFFLRKFSCLIPLILVVFIFNLNCINKKEAKQHFDEAMRVKNTAMSKAIDELRIAVKIDPKYAEAHYHLGTLYHHKQLFDQALEEYKTVQKLDPEFPKLHYVIGALYYTRGVFAWMKAAQIDETFLYKDDGTEVFYKEGADPVKEIGKYKVLTEEDTTDALAFYNLRGVYYDLAIIEYQKAIEANPKDTSAHYDLGLVYMERGFPDKTKAQIQILENISPGHSLGLQQQMEMEEAQKKLLKGGK